MSFAILGNSNPTVILGEFLPQEILKNIGRDKKEYFTKDGKKYLVKMNSIRYRVFNKSTRCCCCGINGTIMRLERHYDNKNIPPHFNLYAINEFNEHILMTKDHIVPRSCGGGDNIDNLQTMCIVCNNLKSNNDVSIEKLRDIKRQYDGWIKRRHGL